jgi:transcriptional regulator with XRE-family HTH domain
VSDRYVCPPDHKHGASSTCYIIHKCRCFKCGLATSQRARRREAAHAAGTFDSGLVDAGPVREHLELLLASGLGWKRVAVVAGVGNTAVSQLIYGRKGSVGDPRKGEVLKRVSRRTADAILAVQPSLDVLADQVLVPARPYARRLEALVAIGWSQSKLARGLGMTPSNFRIIREYERDQARRRRRGTFVYASTARAVVALYERLAFRTPPQPTKAERIAYLRSVSYARARGWPVPMDWAAVDDDFARDVPVRRSAA